MSKNKELLHLIAILPIDILTYFLKNKLNMETQN